MNSFRCSNGRRRYSRDRGRLNHPLRTAKLFGRPAVSGDHSPCLTKLVSSSPTGSAGPLSERRPDPDNLRGGVRAGWLAIFNPHSFQDAGSSVRRAAARLRNEGPEPEPRPRGSHASYGALSRGQQANIMSSLFAAANSRTETYVRGDV